MVTPGLAFVHTFEHGTGRRNLVIHATALTADSGGFGLTTQEGVMVMRSHAAEVSVADAVAVIDALSADVATLSGVEANTVLAEVAVLAAKLDAYRVELVAVIANSSVWSQSAPNATMASFLRAEHLLDHRHASADVRVARAFRTYPALADACHDGRVSREKADLIIAVGEHNQTRADVLAQFMDTFITIAADLSVAQLRVALRAWADQVDPVSTAHADDDAHHRRALHIHHLGDGIKVDGFFSPTQGMKIMAALNAALTAHHRTTTNDNTSDSDSAQRSRQQQRQHGTTNGGSGGSGSGDGVGERACSALRITLRRLLLGNSRATVRRIRCAWLGRWQRCQRC